MYWFAPFPPPAKHAKLWKLYLAGSIAVDLGLLLGLVLFGGLALITVIGDIGQYFNARESKSWLSTTGTITNSGTRREGKNGFGVIANYTYEVDGQKYTGTRLVFSARRPVVPSGADADKMLSPFGRLGEQNEFSGIFDGVFPRTNRNVTVFYDPAIPQDSTLRQEYFANPELGIIWPVFPISALAIAVMVWSTRSWIKYIRTKGYENVGRSRLPA